MSRITERFQQLKAQGRKAFIPYITAGDPDLATTEQILAALAEAGADVIELGVPFSDPMADGPVIQRASERALQQPIGIAEILPLVTRFKAQYDVPIMLFTYFNPLLQFAGDQMGEALQTAGVDGVLITDLIPEEADAFVAKMRAAGIDTIFLVAPTSTDERIQLIANYASGFVYVVARTGVTGVGEQMSQNVHAIVARVRKYTDLPIAVGFGISTHEHVQAVWSYADGAVVGSRLVLEIERHLGAPDLVASVAALTKQLIHG
ncbi:MAG TPA: tryptophan synthase subunit alpha [Blastocatellia bacterium]|nr:tryptophan synthase subunit alpha [Blastocatellia bacterium]